MKGIHNFSEIGKLKKVMLHRIGNEVEGLVPDNFARLLFDDIPYLTAARREHDRFADILRENGVEVVYYIDELAEALSNQQRKDEFLRHLVSKSDLESPATEEALIGYLSSMDTKAMIEKIVAGVRRGEVPDYESPHFADYVSQGEAFYMDPLPNLYMSRDAGAAIGEGISIHHMSTRTRRREALLLSYIYKYSRDFAEPENRKWYDFDDPKSIEGGDILVLSDRLVAIGLSERTTPEAIEILAGNLMKDTGFKRVIVVDIPKTRSTMQLDTIFSMVDHDKFVFHPEMSAPIDIYEMKHHKDGEISFSTMTGTLDEIIKKELKLPAVDFIPCGGTDSMAAQREQWNAASNILALEPGVVISYARNYITNELLDRKGVKVIETPGSELSRGRGGTRSMAFPLQREDI